VEVLQKSLEELKQARARDKDLLEKAKEDNKQYEEKLEVSFDNEGRNGERGECKDPTCLHKTHNNLPLLVHSKQYVAFGTTFDTISYSITCNSELD
ncbi:hypothetical protein Tco_0994191, partial [Tanacetum coccineum]